MRYGHVCEVCGREADLHRIRPDLAGLLTPCCDGCPCGETEAEWKKRRKP